MIWIGVWPHQILWRPWCLLLVQSWRLLIHYWPLASCRCRILSLLEQLGEAKAGTLHTHQQAWTSLTGLSAHNGLVEQCRQSTYRQRINLNSTWNSRGRTAKKCVSRRSKRQEKWVPVKKEKNLRISVHLSTWIERGWKEISCSRRRIGICMLRGGTSTTSEKCVLKGWIIHNPLTLKPSRMQLLRMASPRVVAIYINLMDIW